jgi:isoleucyl-tRNA synthetase
LILAKNLVGKQFGKGFYESKDLTDFENFRKSSITRMLSGFSQTSNNAKNRAFRVISGDFVTIEMEQESFTRHRLWCR